MTFLEENINQVILGKSEDILPKFPDHSFDACICDPPFGIGFEYNQGKEIINDPIQYGDWIKPIYQQIERIVKPGGFIAIFQSGKYFKYLWDWFGDDIYIYATCKDFLQIRSSMPINFGFDPIAIKYLPGTPIRPTAPKRNLNFFVAKTSKAVQKTWDPRRNHPCPRPIDQMMELVENFVIEDGLVLDCFSGSGTTLSACAQLKRRFIGIEKDPEYADLSRKVANLAINNQTTLRGGESEFLF